MFFDKGYFYSNKNGVLVIEDADGRCKAYTTESHFGSISSECAVNDYDYMKYYTLTRGLVLILLDDNRNEWAFVAKSPYYAGTVRKLGMANKRWKKFAEKNRPYRKTFWEWLRGLLKH